MRNSTTFVLAGGKGQRLSPLTDSRAKPLLPFLGTRRLIDFTLFNCVRSGILRPWALTSDDCIAVDLSVPAAWSASNKKLLARMDGHRWVEGLKRPGYRGTADAVRQNLFRISPRARQVLVLSSDHVYTLDYRELLEHHRRKGALATVGTCQVDWSEASRFGILEVDDRGRVRDFHEKPRGAADLRVRAPKASASMGIYVFDSDFLALTLKAVPGDDFGHDILPALVESGGVYAFSAAAPNGGEAYWRDVGTIDAYWETQMELLGRRAETCPPPGSVDGWNPAHWGGLDRLAPRSDAREGRDLQPLVLGRVFRSVLSHGALVCSGAEVRESVLLEGAKVGPGARLRRVIVDRGAVVPASARIGYEREKDERRYAVSEGGVVIVTSQAVASPAVAARRHLLAGRPADALSLGRGMGGRPAGFPD
ncbi:MAG: glucose-1-phosphate adenylyltransferase family protein [Nitrospinota bacterium]